YCSIRSTWLMKTSSLALATSIPTITGSPCMTSSCYPTLRNGLQTQATVRTSGEKNLLRPKLSHGLVTRGKYGLKQAKLRLTREVWPRSGQTRMSGGFLFGSFFLAKQEKGTRPAGRNQKYQHTR